MNEVESHTGDDSPKRISDADRDVVVGRLKSAAGKGLITMDELAERTKVVYEAKYAHQLKSVVADLPEPTSLPVRASQKWRWLVAIMGGREWIGSWRPARINFAITVMGGQTIDLTEVDAGAVTVNALTIMGGTEVIVPAHADVEVGGFMPMGGISSAVKRSDRSGMRITVRCWGLMGGCEVRSAGVPTRNLGTGE